VGESNSGWVAGKAVAVGSVTVVTAGAGVAVALTGAHETRKTATRSRLRKKRGFIIVISFRKYISGNPYEKVTLYPIRAGKGFALTVVQSYAILDLTFRKKNTNQWR
jgi:amino acid transporter